MPANLHRTESTSKKTRQAHQYSRRAVLAGVIPAVVAVGAVGISNAPRMERLGQPTGDEDLAAALRPHLTGHHHVACAVLDGDTTRFAGFGVDEHAEFEIASISKTFTAATTMDAVAQGAVSLDTTVGDILGSRAANSALRDTTLTELATHSAGLPSTDPAHVAQTLGRTLLRKDPYAGSPEEVIDIALGTEPENVGEYAYSNMSIALLAQVVAVATSTPWVEHLKQITQRLGMTHTWAPLTRDALKPDSPHGYTPAGQPAEPWTMDGWAPAGGVRSTASDLVTNLRTMMDGTNPGREGVKPLLDLGEGASQGVIWVINPLKNGGTVTWHNGHSGGFTSFHGYTDDGRGVVILTDTATPLDALALDILEGKVQI